MNSKINIVEQLIKAGNEFNLQNFCYPSNDNPEEYSGNHKPEWIEYKTRVKNFIHQSMSKDSPAVEMLKIALSINTERSYLIKFKQVKASLLKALENTKNALEEDIYGELIDEESENLSPSLSNKVFVVHGHDSELKNDVERFIHEIGLEPIVLHRQADEGNTIIEKFEKNADVGYAFILLTPDEMAYTIDQKDIQNDLKVTEYRARPNVIFEFGYFVGRLGRSKVCCLHKGDTSIPSDLSGLVYKKIDGNIDSIAYSIIKELKAVGYNIKV
jgi:predicted nucleotide-binding protein